MPINPTAWFDIAGRNRSQRAFAEVNQGLNGIRKTGLSLGRVLTGLGGVGSIVGIASLAKTAASMAAELTNASNKLGIGTDFLQEWAYAADRFDISATAANMALQKFSKNISEANQGTGELKATVEELGLNLRDSAGNLRPVEAILNDYADAIKNAANDSDRLRYAIKAFGDEGGALVSILKDGSAGLDVFRQAAHDTGRVIDQEIAQNLADALKKLEDFTAQKTILLGTIAGAALETDPTKAADQRLGLLQRFGQFLGDLPSGWDPVTGETIPVSKGLFGPGLGALSQLRTMAQQPDTRGPAYFPNKSTEVAAYREYMANQGKTNDFLQKIEDHLRAVRNQTQQNASTYAY